MTRGYIKEVPGNAQIAGNHMRMRFVKPGNNADSESVPPNQVIFDSDDVGTLSLIAAGQYRFNRAGAEPITIKIASWSLDYVPLCTFQFRPWPATYWAPFYIPGVASTNNQRILVDRTGITATLLTSTPNYVDIAWQAYRLVAV